MGTSPTPPTVAMATRSEEMKGGPAAVRGSSRAGSDAMARPFARAGLLHTADEIEGMSLGHHDGHERAGRGQPLVDENAAIDIRCLARHPPHEQVLGLGARPLAEHLEAPPQARAVPVEG